MFAPCRYLDGHVKEPYVMSMAWEPDRRSNFFSPPAHLCAVIGLNFNPVEFRPVGSWFNGLCSGFNGNFMFAPGRYLVGHVKEPFIMSIAWEPDRRSNFFSPPAHLCAVIGLNFNPVEFWPVGSWFNGLCSGFNGYFMLNCDPRDSGSL